MTKKVFNVGDRVIFRAQSFHSGKQFYATVSSVSSGGYPSVMYDNVPEMATYQGKECQPSTTNLTVIGIAEPEEYEEWFK